MLIIVFDLDIFKERESDLHKLLEHQSDDLWFGLTNPDFELFLLLHVENAIDEIIMPNKQLIKENKKIGNHRPCYKLLSEQTKINSKKNAAIGNLAHKIDIAIKQEKEINQDLSLCMRDITSNIASLIEKIRNDKLPI